MTNLFDRALRRLRQGVPNLAKPWTVPFHDRATRADILHCFRLLLARHPHREEWVGHASRAGEPLEHVVSTYLRSHEFARRGLLERPATALPSRAEVQGFAIYAATDDEDVGRHVHGDNYEPYVMAVFRRLLRPGMSVVDIGANIGYFTMLSASIVGPSGHVLAVEPNPENARMIEASRRLNGYEQVTVAQVAAGQQVGLLVLSTTQTNGTTAAPFEEAALLLAARTVACLPVDMLVAPGRRVDLIKIDVEGAEYSALLGAAALIGRDRPAIISEFSPDQMPGMSGPGYLEWLIGQGYGIGVIGHDGVVGAAVRQAAPIMAAYRAAGRDHIDLLATVA